jgi:hypothetical protein
METAVVAVAASAVEPLALAEPVAAVEPLALAEPAAAGRQERPPLYENSDPIP